MSDERDEDGFMRIRYIETIPENDGDEIIVMHPNHINIFVGANNARKSTFMRNITKNETSTQQITSRKKYKNLFEHLSKTHTELTEIIPQLARLKNQIIHGYRVQPNELYESLDALSNLQQSNLQQIKSNTSSILPMLSKTEINRNIDTNEIRRTLALFNINQELTKKTINYLTSIKVAINEFATSKPNNFIYCGIRSSLVC